MDVIPCTACEQGGLCEFHAAARHREYAEPQDCAVQNTPAAGRERILGSGPCSCARCDAAMSRSVRRSFAHPALRRAGRLAPCGAGEPARGARARPDESREMDTESGATGARRPMRLKSTESAGSRAHSAPGTDSRPRPAVARAHDRGGGGPGSEVERRRRSSSQSSSARFS